MHVLGNVSFFVRVAYGECVRVYQQDACGMILFCRESQTFHFFRSLLKY